MPRLYHRKARTDRYKFGRKVEVGRTYSSEPSTPIFKTDFSQPRVPFDELICKKGEMYYTWHPKGSPWQFSSTKPDLRPEWEKTFSDLQERVEQLSDDLDLDRAELSSEIEEMRDELQSRLDNIPEQLQESSVLNSRIEELDGLIFGIEEMN